MTFMSFCGLSPLCVCLFESTTLVSAWLVCVFIFWRLAVNEQIVAIMASRFIVMPMLAAGLLLTGAKAKLIPYDKLVWFVLLMEG